MSSDSIAQEEVLGDYTCKFEYLISNGSILGGGGNVNIKGEQTFDLTYPTHGHHIFVENKRSFYSGLYFYENKVHIEIKVFKEGQSTWQGLISVVSSTFDTFQEKLSISSFVNVKEKVEHYQLNCLKKSVSTLVKTP